MILHSNWVLGLGQNVEQIVIRQEEEAREEQLFGVQILVKLFLHVFDRFIAVFQVLESAVLVASVKNYWVSLRLRHDNAPHFVHRGESQIDLW